MSDFLFLIFTMVQIPENHKMSLFYEDKISELIEVDMWTIFSKRSTGRSQNIYGIFFIQNCPNVL